MGGILLFSHSGFSDTDANGITIKNLLSAWPAEEKAEFYCDVTAPDFTAAQRYFRVTDMQMVKAFLGKKSQHIFTYSANSEEKREERKASGKSARKIPRFLKKRKYNFGLKWLREYLWKLSPWGHRRLRAWIDEVAPDALVYMVGESIFLDRLVLKVCKETARPLILYNCEAYRIIDLNRRKGLERAYYRKTRKLYAKLNDRASMVIYNCAMLQEGYEALYPKAAKTMLAYNTAACDQAPYEPTQSLKITYFGNLGVGRSDTLTFVAKLMKDIDASLVLDIYGNASPEVQEQFEACENIRYHGFLDAKQLHTVIEASDILLHVESFAPEIVNKLRYAFSTKIAQCLCAGRCFVSYAPKQIASTQYLLSVGAAVATNEQELRSLLENLVTDGQLRLSYAQDALRIGLQNHDRQTTAQRVRDEIGAMIHEV